ncbi:MAG: hypothetical protein LUP91_07030, partial [Methylococcaceae bacterium]|nr:hypothetical protein [Methylococcaceae bacterium]
MKIDSIVAPSIEVGIFQPTTLDGYIDFRLKLDPEDYSYDYSKLYYSVSPSDPYSEEQVICFRVRFRNIFEQIRLVLP